MKVKIVISLVLLLFVKLTGLCQNGEFEEQYGIKKLLEYATAGDSDAANQLQNLADKSDATMAANMYGTYLWSIGNIPAALPYYLKAAANNYPDASFNYVKAKRKLRADEKELKNWLENLYKSQLDAANRERDPVALYWLYIFYSENWDKYLWDNYAPTDLAEAYLKMSVREGYAPAKYEMAMYYESNPIPKEHLFRDACLGDYRAFAHLAKILTEEGAYDEALNICSKYDDPKYKHFFTDTWTYYISTEGLATLIRFIQNHPQYSLTGFGPDKSSNNKSVLFMRDGYIYACATLNGKAGVLKLTEDGRLENRETVPFIYDYIVPTINERFPISKAEIFFYVNSYSEPRKDGYTRAIDLYGFEIYLNFYGEYTSIIETGTNFIIDCDEYTK